MATSPPSVQSLLGSVPTFHVAVFSAGCRSAPAAAARTCACSAGVVKASGFSIEE